MLKRVLAALAGLSAVAAIAAVDLNQANDADLDSFKGIGPVLSGRIIEERQHGRFKDWADFIGRVKGVGPAQAARFSAAGLTIDGRGFASPAPPAKSGAAEEAVPTRAGRASNTASSAARP